MPRPGEDGALETLTGALPLDLPHTAHGRGSRAAARVDHGNARLPPLLSSGDRHQRASACFDIARRNSGEGSAIYAASRINQLRTSASAASHRVRPIESLTYGE
jgi:hypothetical protein